MSVLKYRVFVLVMNADSRQCSGGDKLKKKKLIPVILKRHPCVLKMELIISFDTILMTLRQQIIQQINPKQNSVSNMATTSARNDQRSSHKIHSVSNDCSVAANSIKQFKFVNPLLFKQPLS